jgi:hypothetical protein
MGEWRESGGKMAGEWCVSKMTWATYPRGFLREGNKNISLNADMLIIFNLS